MKRWTSVVVALGLGASAGAGALFAVNPWLPTWPVVAGVRVEGRDVSGDGAEGRVLQELEDALNSRSVTLRFPDASRVFTLGELGAFVDRTRVNAAVRDVGHCGSLGQRLRDARAARGGLVDLRVSYVLDRDVATRRIAELAPQFDRAPVDATIDLDKRQRTADVDGRRLDVAATVNALGDALDDLARGLSDGIDFRATSLKAKVTLANFENVDVSKVLASFETRYSIYKVGRAKNVELAAKRLDGTLVPPGGEVSFNGVVGPRTREAGFHEAPEIFGDELTTGIGGGTCQVSSTLYGAVLHAGLTVVDRRNHSRPSDYTKLGLDATVKYPEVDFRFRNDYPFAVIVHSFMPKPGLLRVELLGGESVDRVDYFYAVSGVEPYLRRITEKSYMQPGSAVRKQKGTRGMSVHSTLVLRYKDGRVERRNFFSGYRATPEVFWVAPNYDRAELPPLPEHAKGVEGEPLAGDGDAFAG